MPLPMPTQKEIDRLDQQRRASDSGLTSLTARVAALEAANAAPYWKQVASGSVSSIVNNAVIEPVGNWSAYFYHYWVMVCTNINASANWNLGMYPEIYAPDLITDIGGLALGNVSQWREDYIATGVLAGAVGADNRIFEITRGLADTVSPAPAANGQTGRAESSSPFPYGSLNLVAVNINSMTGTWYHFVGTRA